MSLHDRRGNYSGGEQLQQFVEGGVVTKGGIASGARGFVASRETITALIWVTKIRTQEIP